MIHINKLVIETEAPDDYMVEILRAIRVSIKRGEYSGRGKVNRADMVIYPYVYTYTAHYA